VLERVAPPFSGRRMLLKLAVGTARQPRRARARVNRHNLRELRRFRKVEARCNVCGHVGPLLYEMPDLVRLREHRIGTLRETLRCEGCKSKMRDRTLAAGLLRLSRERWGVEATTIDELARVLPPEARILDTDAQSRIGRRLARHPGVLRSLYYPDRGPGEELEDRWAGARVVNVDLEAMPFPDASYDVVITSEVMEHVRHVDTAHREIARCLAPGGTYLFTVPFDPTLEQTWVLIDAETDQPLVLPMHLHGDPGLREEGIKSYRVFGHDLADDLARAGLEGGFAPVDDPRAGIWDGDLWVATKA
jgi:SAM-dependent methyltransferase